MKQIILFLFTTTLVFISMHSHAQDSHLSQWKENPVLLNPAETGRIIDGEVRIIATYRSQWGNFGSGITTTAISFDMKRGKRKMTYGGYLKSSNLANIFTNTSFVGSAAYEITKPSNKKYHIKTGVQIGGAYKRFDQNKLTFDNQYNNGNFDSDLPNGENFVVESKLLPETAIGFSYYNTYKKNKLKPFGGFSASHLTKPKISYSGEMITSTPAKWSGYAGSIIELDKWFTITPYALYMKQGSATELFAGIATNYRFNIDVSAVLDIGYRNKDAAIIQAGINIRDSWYRISYDINTSPMKNFIRGSNALEFSVTVIPKGRFF